MSERRRRLSHGPFRDSANESSHPHTTSSLPASLVPYLQNSPSTDNEKHEPHPSPNYPPPTRQLLPPISSLAPENRYRMEESSRNRENLPSLREAATLHSGLSSTSGSGSPASEDYGDRQHYRVEHQQRQDHLPSFRGSTSLASHPSEFQPRSHYRLTPVHETVVSNIARPSSALDNAYLSDLSTFSASSSVRGVPPPSPTSADASTSMSSTSSRTRVQSWRRDRRSDGQARRDTNEGFYHSDTFRGSQSASTSSRRVPSGPIAESSSRQSSSQSHTLHRLHVDEVPVPSPSPLSTSLPRYSAVPPNVHRTELGDETYYSNGSSMVPRNSRQETGSTALMPHGFRSYTYPATSDERVRSHQDNATSAGRNPSRQFLRGPGLATPPSQFSSQFPGHSTQAQDVGREDVRLPPLSAISPRLSLSAPIESNVQAEVGASGHSSASTGLLAPAPRRRVKPSAIHSQSEGIAEDVHSAHPGPGPSTLQRSLARKGKGKEESQDTADSTSAQANVEEDELVDTTDEDGQPHFSIGSAPSRSASAGGTRAPRTKIEVACDFCRKRKMRCDGLRPTCRNCQRKNVACSYIPVVRRRGPGKKQKAMDTRPKKTNKRIEGEKRQTKTKQGSEAPTEEMQAGEASPPFSTSDLHLPPLYPQESTSLYGNSPPFGGNLFLPAGQSPTMDVREIVDDSIPNTGGSALSDVDLQVSTSGTMR